MTTWEEVPLFTVGNPGVSSAELARGARERLRNKLIIEGRLAATVSRRRQGLPQQITLEM